MIIKGDLVERSDDPGFDCIAGEVTGFCPNGKVRVRLTNGKRRYWPVSLLRVTQADEKAHLAYEAWERHAEFKRMVRDFMDKRGYDTNHIIWKKGFRVALKRDRLKILEQFSAR